jgi:hypothetical protein
MVIVIRDTAGSERWVRALTVTNRRFSSKWCLFFPRNDDVFARASARLSACAQAQYLENSRRFTSLAATSQRFWGDHGWPSPLYRNWALSARSLMATNNCKNTNQRPEQANKHIRNAIYISTGNLFQHRTPEGSLICLRPERLRGSSPRPPQIKSKIRILPLTNFQTCSHYLKIFFVKLLLS